ncbi:MAG: mechanosensitive ion channel [Betaproteobacteria bacterium]|nr:mechanosensitive ion channel [Betaproteobacteria bacterium]
MIPDLGHVPVLAASIDQSIPIPSWLKFNLVRVGDTSITAANVILAVVFVTALWWIAALFERSLHSMFRDDPHAPQKSARVHLLGKLGRYTIWIVGTAVGLNQLGIDLTSIALLGGGIAVGLGFGLQAIFSNFVSGIILLLERSLKVGDFVDLESGVRGHVREIAMRYTRVTTNDAIDILVPNAEFINGRVTNWTLDDAFRRIRVPFGVAYGTDKNIVREAGVAAARSVDGVLTLPGREPEVWLVSYGDSALNFELVIWADRDLTTRPGRTQARLMWALDDELAARGVEIPFPQRDLHVKSGTIGVRIERESEAG